MKNETTAERRVTLEREGTAELEEKKSVFIGRAKPITEEVAALAYIKEMKTKYADARHNVWAYRLYGDAVMRCSDDGEPQGSAGVPVLDALRKSGVSDAVIVVTRYFGGVLLGAGGLVRAYSKAAKLAINEAHIITREKCAVWSVTCSYSDYRRFLAELPKFGAIAGETMFSESVTFAFTVRADVEEKLLSRVREMSGGNVIPRKIGEKFEVVSENH